MQKIPRTFKSIAGYLPSILAAFAAGLLLNITYQTAKHYDALVPRAHFAVFVGKSIQTAHRIIGEKIINIEGVKSVVYVPQDKALETAMKNAPALKEIMVSGDNPFSSYFIVEPREKSFGAAQWLKNQIAAVEGVEDIRFDADTFAIVDRLGMVTRFYNAGIIGLFIAGFIVALLRFLMQWLYRLIDYRHYLRLLGGGAAAGALGAGIYWLISSYGVEPTIAQLPGLYFAYMVLAGIIAAAVEN